MSFKLAVFFAALITTINSLAAPAKIPDPKTQSQGLQKMRLPRLHGTVTLASPTTTYAFSLPLLKRPNATHPERRHLSRLSYRIARHQPRAKDAQEGFLASTLEPCESRVLFWGQTVVLEGRSLRDDVEV